MDSPLECCTGVKQQMDACWLFWLGRLEANNNCKHPFSSFFNLCNLLDSATQAVIRLVCACNAHSQTRMALETCSCLLQSCYFSHLIFIFIFAQNLAYDIEFRYRFLRILASYAKKATKQKSKLLILTTVEEINLWTYEVIMCWIRPLAHIGQDLLHSFLESSFKTIPTKGHGHVLWHWVPHVNFELRQAVLPFVWPRSSAEHSDDPPSASVLREEPNTLYPLSSRHASFYAHLQGWA